MDSITQLIVTDEFNSERLDVFITRVFDVIPSRSYSNKLILNKKVKVDNKFQKPSFRLKTNQIVEVISVNSPSIYDSPIGFKGKILRVVLLSVLGLSFGFFFLYIKNFRYAYLLRN
jgi:23S rRNA-/tRNA-specific pseudouridylate synthase